MAVPAIAIVPDQRKATELIAETTAPGSVEFNVEGGTILAIHHQIYGATLSAGGYHRLERCEKRRADARADDAVSIKATAASGLVRSANVVTVNTATPHGLVQGQQFVIEDSAADGATTFDGRFTVKAVTDADTFTFDQTAANDTGGGGVVYPVAETLLSTTLTGWANNNPASAQAASYVTTYWLLAKGVLRLVLYVTDGTHRITAQAWAI